MATTPPKQIGQGSAAAPAPARTPQGIRIKDDPSTNGRIGKKLRVALDYLATSGRTQREAAELADMNEKSLSKALKRTHVKAELERIKALHSMDLQRVEGNAKKEAILAGLQLLRDAKSESVKARMVELFAGLGTKTPSVTINNTVQNTVKSAGYEYAPPGSRVVEITGRAVDVTPEDEGDADT